MILRLFKPLKAITSKTTFKEYWGEERGATDPSYDDEPSQEELKRDDRHEMAEAEGVENGHAEPPGAQEES